MRVTGGELARLGKSSPTGPTRHELWIYRVRMVLPRTMQNLMSNKFVFGQRLKCPLVLTRLIFLNFRRAGRFSLIFFGTFWASRPLPSRRVSAQRS